MEKEKMGAFIARIRKEKKMTQKDLAELLHITDKAVSKWERGMSYPDISLLEPLSQMLGVSILELLEGERISKDITMNMEDVQEVVQQSISISDGEINRKHVRSKAIILSIVLLVMLLVSMLLNILNAGYGKEMPRLSADAKAYITTVDEQGNIVFADPQKALEQLLKDLGIEHVCEEEP